MKLSLQEVMANKADEELENNLININKYTSEAIHALIDELKKRNRQFTTAELEHIETVVQRKLVEETDDTNSLSKNKQWEKNIVTNLDAPQYYTKKAIYVFSLLSGSILLALNIKDSKHKWIVITFGILFTCTSLFILNQFGRSTPLTLGINALGAWILTSYFWNKFIGEAIEHRTKPIWIPLIICVLICIPIVWASIYANQV